MMQGMSGSGRQVGKFQWLFRDIRIWCFVLTCHFASTSNTNMLVVDGETVITTEIDDRCSELGWLRTI